MKKTSSAVHQQQSSSHFWAKMLTFPLFFFALSVCVGYGYIMPCHFSSLRSSTRIFGSSKRNKLENAVPKFVRVFREIEGRVQDDPLFPMIECIAKTADDRKAVTVKAFRVTHMTEVTQFIVLVVGSNNRQISAIASSIEEDVTEKFKEIPYGKDGTAVSGWFVLDYGSVITHVMTPAMSSFYKLEKKWHNAEHVDLTHIIKPPTPMSNENADSSGKGSMDDWGFHGGEDGGEVDSFSFDAGLGRGSSTSTSTSDNVHARGGQQVPAEDVAFWGEELAEQMYYQDQHSQSGIPEETAKMAGTDERGECRPDKSLVLPSASPEIDTGDKIIKTRKSLLGRGLVKKLINVDSL